MTFFVELQLDDILKVLLVVEVEFLSYKTYINTKGIFNENNYNDLFIKGGDNYLFNLSNQKKTKKKLSYKKIHKRQNDRKG